VRRLAVCLAVAALAAVPLAGGAGAEEIPSDYKSVEGKSQPVYTEFVDEEYRVPTDHGTIYGVVRRPVVPEGVKVPVILTYSPYHVLDRPVAAMTAQTDAFTMYYASRGYARASFDLVGTRESSGCYDHGGIREQETARDVIEFLGTQEWSSGKVGMIGGSYDGTTQWAGAILNPPHLTTIVPQVAIGRWYDYAYGQGVRFASGNGTPLLFDFGFGFLPPTGVTGGVAWAEALRDHVTPCERVEHNERAFLPDPVYDEFWDERDYVVKAADIRASVLVVGSWTDYNVHPVNSLEMYEALPDSHPKRIVMGQAGHSGTQVEDSTALYHAWFDHWLLGLDTGAMTLPRSDSVVQTKDRFQDDDWPPSATVDVPLALGRGEVGKGSVGLLDLELAQWTDDNPALDQSDVLGADRTAEGRSLLFLGPAVEGYVRISGVPRLDVTVTTDAASTHLTPVLFEEDSGGSRQVITRGLLNSRNRDGLRTSTPVTPGEPWRGTVAFQPVDWLLEEGSRLGLAMMSMNSAEALYSDDTLATNELLLDESRLVVPVSLGAARLGTAVTRPQPVRPAPVPPLAGPAPRPDPAPRPGPLPATGGDVTLMLAGTAAAGSALLLRRRRRA
jgi:X-Pro dipeptidyl-peptidase